MQGKHGPALLIHNVDCMGRVVHFGSALAFGPLDHGMYLNFAFALDFSYFGLFPYFIVFIYFYIII